MAERVDAAALRGIDAIVHVYVSAGKLNNRFHITSRSFIGTVNTSRAQAKPVYTAALKRVQVYLFPIKHSLFPALPLEHLAGKSPAGCAVMRLRLQPLRVFRSKDKAGLFLPATPSLKAMHALRAEQGNRAFLKGAASRARKGR